MAKPSGSAWLAALAALAAAGLILALHTLDPNYLPARHELAQYILGEFGSLMRLALALLAAACASLAYALIVERRAASRLGAFALLLAAFGFLFAAFFPPGPGGVASLLTEQVHAGSLGMARFTTMLGALAVAWRVRREKLGWLSLLLAFALAATWYALQNAPDGLAGWPDRVYMLALVAWLTTASLIRPKG